jgi:hypothetical protein
MTDMTAENVDKQLPSEDQAQTSNTYTEEQVREIYNEGLKSGYISAIKTIRSNMNDYLDQLIIATSMKGE